MAFVSFDATREDRALIARIADRAVALGYGDRLDIEMDVCALHSNGMPLDLEKLLSADDFNLAHDVLGIMDHINRRTGRLFQSGPRARFLPRCLKRDGDGES